MSIDLAAAGAFSAAFVFHLGVTWAWVRQLQADVAEIRHELALLRDDLLIFRAGNGG